MLTYEEIFKLIILLAVFSILLHFISKTIIDALKQDKYKRKSIKTIEKEIKKRLEKANKGGVKK